MNYSKIIPFMFFLIGVFLLSLSILSFTSPDPIEEKKEKNINLALRQAAHDIYKNICDDNSQIPPVEKTGPSSYSLKFEKAIYFDSMPELLNSALLDFGIEEPYSVFIESCHGDTILLGYTLQSLKKQNVACMGREITESCNYLKIEFERPVENSGTSYLLFSLFSFLIGIIAFRKKSELVVAHSNSDSQGQNERIRIGKTYFDFNNLFVEYNGQRNKLTYREAKLLKLLAVNQNVIMKREDIQDHVWRDEGTIVSRSLDVFISRLRKLLKPDDSITLKNIHGVGYRLETLIEN